MNPMTMATESSSGRLLPLLAAALTLISATAASASAPGVSGTSFNLTASPAYLTQPSGQMIYSWGYACSVPTGATAPTPVPAAITAPLTVCNGTMQVPGPTLVVTEGQTISVTLTNNLPPAAGNTSILFPGLQLLSAGPAAGQPSSCTAATPAPQGLLAVEAANGCAVTYRFLATTPGTRGYSSGTQGDLQVEMGLYGAVIVLPATAPGPSDCPAHNLSAGLNTSAGALPGALVANGEGDFRLGQWAYNHPKTCYDREYLFQFSEIDPNIHTQAQLQVAAKAGCVANAPGCSLNVPTEPYHPAYFMINGRSMPDDMDPNYTPQYPHQPYNGNPHMHPGDQVLLRIIGQGRWQHPFHEHGNHVRILARDGNLILTPDGTGLAGPLLFTTTTTPGLAMDGIFYFTGRGLNWDMYGHNPDSGGAAALACTPDANGYNTLGLAAGFINYYEWCQDHNKPIEAKPFGSVPGGGPATLPDPGILRNGPWYGGSNYLGPDANRRAVGGTPIPPSGTIANNPRTEAGYAFMWHSHNEREITTNNIFPGGMLMMMLVDSREFLIDESQ